MRTADAQQDIAHLHVFDLSDRTVAQMNERASDKAGVAVLATAYSTSAVAAGVAACWSASVSAYSGHCVTSTKYYRDNTTFRQAV